MTLSCSRKDKGIEKEKEEFNYILEQFADLRVLRYQVPGFDELSFTPGAYGKLGIMFEFGKFDEVIHALDAGIVIDVFIKKIPIMAIENNNQIFFSLFVSYRFGKVIDVRFKQRKTKIDEILTD